MSEENVEVVRRFNDPYERKDVAPVIHAAVEVFEPDPDPDVVLAHWAEDPSWRYAHPDIEWDVSAPGVASTLKGAREVALWWADWTQAWKSYVYRTIEYRDLGVWVLTPTDVQATGPGDIAVEMRIFQIWKVRDGKIAACRVFLSEAEALEAAGPTE